MNNQTPLTNDQIQKSAPSAFAGQPWSKQSDRYTFVSTSTIIDGMRSNGLMPVSASQSRSRIAGKQMFTKHMIRFRQEGMQTQLGDSVLETILINSHDGTSSYELMLGVFRLVCLNGLVVGDTFESIRVRHVGNIVDKVVEGSHELLQNAGKIAVEIQTWRNILLSMPEQQILAEGVHSLRFGQDSDVAKAITPDKLLTVRRSSDTGNDLWSVFNRLQENAIRGGLRSSWQPGRTRVRSREVSGIDQNVRLNKEIWTLAEKMAELKS